MRLHYAFTNLCGTVYRQGPILFEPNTHALLAAVGNRVSTYNLKTNATTTLPVEARTNVVSLAIAPDGASLITVDADGRLLFINLRTRAVVAHLNLKRKCAAVAFSPDGRHVAFALGRLVQVWRTPQLERSFTPFELHHTLGGHGDDVLCLAWSSDSLFLASGGLDMNVVVHSLHSLESYKPPALTGHRSSVKSAFFAEDDRAIYAVAKDSSVSVWRLAARPDADPDEVDRARAASVAAYGAGRGESWLGHWWELAARHFFEKSHARVVSAAYHATARILVVGFNSGVFALYEMPGCTEVHTLSISDGRVDTCAISPGGEWLAFGCAQLGQLLVWEWQAESYVLKQQGHFFAEVTALAYSPGGTIIATGGGDAKVKLWSPASGFCFVTFSEHTAAVSDVAFVPHGRAVLSASLDGTVRAYDLLRYRNFQTLVTPTAAQLECVAVDPSGEIVCAGSRDTLVVYVWSLQTATLLESLAGHEGPISALAFGATSGGTSCVLASASWDKTVRVWDFVSSSSSIDVLKHSSDVLAIAFHPSGSTLAVATLNGEIALWDAREAVQTATIDGRADISGGRSALSRVSARNQSGGRCFRSLCFSADGRSVLAGGNSKFVCLYDVEQRLLMRKYVLSNNTALDGVRMQLNSAQMTDAGPLEDIVLDDDSDDPTAPPPPPRTLGRRSERITRLAARCACVRFSPDNRSWAAASTEGLVIFSLDETTHFDPSGLELHTTPEAVVAAATRGEHGAALAMALCLNEADLVRGAWQRVPHGQIALVAGGIPQPYIERLLRFLGGELDTSRHVHLVSLWVEQLLLSHGMLLRERAATYEVPLRALAKATRARYDELSRVADANFYALAFLEEQLRLHAQGAKAAT